VAQRRGGLLRRGQPVDQDLGAPGEQGGAHGRLALERGAPAQHVGELGPSRIAGVQRVERRPCFAVVGPGRDQLGVRLGRALGELELALVDPRDRAQRIARLGAAFGDLADAAQRLDHLGPPADRAVEAGELDQHRGVGGREVAQPLERVDRVVRAAELVGVDRGELAQQLGALGLGRGGTEPRVGALLERRRELDVAPLGAVERLDPGPRDRIGGQHAEDAAQLGLGVARLALLAADRRDLHQ